MSRLVCVVAAYLVGSISFAMIASWIFRLPDPRSYGSGNPGATNVLRSGRKAAALLTLLGDAAKGLATVLLARHFASVFGFGDGTVAASGVAVFLGHLYPLYFGFKGGKGVSTALGVVLGLSPWLALIGLVVFIVVAALSRYVSLASIAAAVTVAVASAIRLGSSPYTGAIVIIAALVVWRHHANIARLLSGSERKLNFGRRETPPADPAG